MARGKRRVGSAPTTPGRGHIWMAELGATEPHPVIIVTRDEAIPVLTSLTCIFVTSTIREGHRAQVMLGRENGLDHECAANCDVTLNVDIDDLRHYVGELNVAQMFDLGRALKFALDLP